jgi:hypothetical protein
MDDVMEMHQIQIKIKIILAVKIVCPLQPIEHYWSIAA